MKNGFTLIEVLVSVAIFSVVMIIALGSLLAMAESDRKAQTLKSVINNLNFSLESMSRTIRTGTNYNCSSPAGGDCTAPNDGKNHGYFAFVPAGTTAVTIYCLSAGSANSCNTSAACPAGSACRVLRSIDGGSNFAPMTSPEVNVTNLTFYVTGSSRTDAFQSKVTILLSGYVQVSASQRSQFNVQASATQRLYDIP